MTDGYRDPPSADAVEVGDSGPRLRVEDLSRVDFAKYAGASGDFYPLHVDEAYAMEAGNESVFGHGMLTAGIASHMVSDWFGLANITGFSCRFRAKVYPGDDLSIAGEIVSVEEGTEGTVVEAELETTNQADETVLTGTVQATLD